MYKNAVSSVYIHIPFCKNICSYCDFCKNFYNEELVKKYLTSLKYEIKENYNNEVIKTLYIGGGTPSSLSFDNLKLLFNSLKLIKLDKNLEFTFECNYEDITPELLSFLKDNKINRLSIGIQSFNDKFQSILERKINKTEMIDKILLAKKYFNNINLDLIYGIKNQSINDIKEDLNELLKLDINHISTYCLILENNTKLKVNNYIEEEEDIQSNMYFEIIKTLINNGYKHYELSNFSKEGFESKHNLVYWNNNRYYGFGAGASGFINNIRYDNTKSIINYINGKTKVYEEVVDVNQELKDEIMLGLRKNMGINKKEFYNKYKKDVYECFDIKDFIHKQYLIDDNENIFISNKYLFVSNVVISNVIDSYILN